MIQETNGELWNVKWRFPGQGKEKIKYEPLDHKNWISNLEVSSEFFIWLLYLHCKAMNAKQKWMHCNGKEIVLTPILMCP